VNWRLSIFDCRLKGQESKTGFSILASEFWLLTSDFCS
jgi:hypothetical protein